MFCFCFVRPKSDKKNSLLKVIIFEIQCRAKFLRPFTCDLRFNPIDSCAGRNRPWRASIFVSLLTSSSVTKIGIICTQVLRRKRYFQWYPDQRTSGLITWPFFSKDDSFCYQFGKSIQSKLKNPRNFAKFGFQFFFVQYGLLWLVTVFSRLSERRILMFFRFFPQNIFFTKIRLISS